MSRRATLSITVLLVLAGCAGIEPGPDLQAVWCRDIETAITTPVALLEQEAANADGHAQLAYSIVLRYGLNGVARNAAAADGNLASAMAQRGTSTTAIYVPGYKKVAGHTQIISVPVYDVGSPEAQAVNACAALLAAAAPPSDLADRLASGTCGGADNFARLQAEWRQAATHSK